MSRVLLLRFVRSKESLGRDERSHEKIHKDQVMKGLICSARELRIFPEGTVCVCFVNKFELLQIALTAAQRLEGGKNLER